MLPAPQEHLGVVKDIVFEGCSPRVEKALSADIMKSVKSVVSDLLASLPMLLYQGPLPSNRPGCTALLYNGRRDSCELFRCYPYNLHPFAVRSTVLLSLCIP